MVWTAIAVLCVTVFLDYRRGATFEPVVVVPCTGPECDPGTRESWVRFSDDFQGRAGPFAPTDYCQLSIEYIRSYTPDSYERRFVVDLLEDRYVTVTPTDDDTAVTLSPGPRAWSLVWGIRGMFSDKPLGCHLSGWGIWPAMLWLLGLGLTNYHVWRRSKDAAQSF